MRCRLLSLLVLLVAASCSGGDKHLPSSNPPEYDPKKVYQAPSTPAAPSLPASQPAKPAELQLLESKLQLLEADQKAKGEGKKMPFNQDSLQLLKGVPNPCEVLSRLVPALGSGQLFVGSEGAALKKALGPDADAIARRMDEQLAEGLKQSLGPGAADCRISGRPRKRTNLSPPPHLVLTSASLGQPLLSAQTTIPDTSRDDYDVQDPGIQHEDAPPDWIGYKETHAVTRIGKVGRPTEGIYESYSLVIAPKAKKCPHLEGPNLARIIHDCFCCNRGFAAATSRHAAGWHAGRRARPSRPRHTVSSMPWPLGAPRARLAWRLRDFATNPHE